KQENEVFQARSSPRIGRAGRNRVTLHCNAETRDRASLALGGGTQAQNGLRWESRSSRTRWNKVPPSRGKQFFQAVVKRFGLGLDTAEAEVGAVVVDDTQAALALLAQLVDATRIAIAEHDVDMRRPPLGRAIEVDARYLPVRRQQTQLGLAQQPLGR